MGLKTILGLKQRPQRRLKPPIKSPAGHTQQSITDAEAMLRMQGAALGKLLYFRVEASELQITGFAQTPFDPISLKFRDRNAISIIPSFTAPVALERSRETPGHSETFWYYPEVDNSGIGLHVSLAALPFGTEELRFTINFDTDDDAAAALGRTYWLPPLHRFFGFPGPAMLQRVQTFDDAMTAGFGGFSDARRLRAFAELHGMKLGGAAILDWGCGHGRVLRHFIQDGDIGRCVGVDIDGENIGWAYKHLHGGEFGIAPMMPPTNFLAESFNLVIGVSVLTHLPPNVQTAWLDEIARILRPGGLALLTIAGPAAFAYSSRFRTTSHLDEFLGEGVCVVETTVLQGVIADPSYYKNVMVTHEFIRSNWPSSLVLEEIYPRAFGYQDLCVLRRR